jgi:hypothetical protein
MVDRVVDSRFSLSLHPATVSSTSLLIRTADAIDENTSAFSDTFTLGTLPAATAASHSSVFVHQVHKERKIRSFVFNHLRTLFHFLQKSETPSPLFSATSTLFARNTRGIPLPVKIRPSVSLGSASQEFRFRGINTDRPGNLDLVDGLPRNSRGRFSLCLYFVTSLLRPFTRRNLISCPIILWRRDTEPIDFMWVYTRSWQFTCKPCLERFSGG